MLDRWETAWLRNHSPDLQARRCALLRHQPQLFTPKRATGTDRGECHPPSPCTLQGFQSSRCKKQQNAATWSPSPFLLRDSLVPSTGKSVSHHPSCQAEWRAGKTPVFWRGTNSKRLPLMLAPSALPTEPRCVLRRAHSCPTFQPPLSLFSHRLDFFSLLSTTLKSSPPSHGLPVVSAPALTISRASWVR